MTTDDHSIYFREGIFGPTGLLAERTPKQFDYLGRASSRGVYWKDDALLACRSAAIAELIKRDGYMYIQQCGDRGFNAQDMPEQMHPNVDAAIIAAIKAVKGAA